ncbi:MAG: nucleotidyltransferase domain-containing protein [Thermodesulfobacteriota bacterium]
MNSTTDYFQILKEFAEKVRRVYPEARIRAYGSYTRGTATHESDLDVCVVLKQVTPNDRFRISDLAWEVGFDNEVFISTIVISEKEYEHGPLSDSPLIESIRTEGVAA